MSALDHHDVGKLTGMTVIYAGLDLEQAAEELASARFEAAELFVGHLGPRVVEAPVVEAHATAAAKVLDRRGLSVSTLNCIVGTFDPFTSAESRAAAAASLAGHLRLAAACGSPRVLIWDGECDRQELLAQAPKRLAEVVERGRVLSHLGSPPAISVELHPNTFAYKYRLHEAVAAELLGVGAGVCLDFCHAAVAFGPEFAETLSDEFMEAVQHVHFADSDAVSEQLHFPPGDGCVNIDAAVRRLVRRRLPVGWDLFGWPAPRFATRSGMMRYREAVDAIAGKRGDVDHR